MMSKTLGEVLAALPHVQKILQMPAGAGFDFSDCRRLVAAKNAIAAIRAAAGFDGVLAKLLTDTATEVENAPDGSQVFRFSSAESARIFHTALSELMQLPVAPPALDIPLDRLSTLAGMASLSNEDFVILVNGFDYEF